MRFLAKRLSRPLVVRKKVAVLVLVAAAGALAILNAAAHAKDDKDDASVGAKNPQQLAELFVATVQAGEKTKAGELVPPKDIAEKAVAALPFSDEETRRKQTPLLIDHFAGLKPKFGESLKLAADFAKENKFDWKNVSVKAVEVKTRVGPEGMERFSKMTIRLSLADDKESSITIEMDDGTKFGDVWYFTDAPLAIELHRDDKTVRQGLRKEAK
jgi:hypothetical protein